MKRYFGRLLLALIALLMLISVFVNIAPHMGMLIGDIGSGSMIPTFDIGTMVVAVKVDPESLKVGDIILFQLSPTSNNYTSHRIVTVSHNSPLTFTTKGDNNPVPDPTPVPAVDVFGKIVFSLPYLGSFVQSLKTTFGFVLGLIIPALILIVICGSLIWKELVRMIREKVRKGNGL